jgi:hypothetical protein
LLNFSHSLGRKKNGKQSICLLDAVGKHKSWKFLSCNRLSLIFLTFVSHKSWKIVGSKLLVYLWINCRLKNEIRLGKGRTSSFFIRGSVCAFYPCLHIILIAFFCIFKSLLVRTGPYLDGVNKMTVKSQKINSFRERVSKMFFAILNR